MNIMNAFTRALIFDMDGVIVDSTRTHTEAWKRYLQHQGITVDHIEIRMLGKRNDEIVRDFFTSEPLDDGAIREHGAAKERLYRELMRPALPNHLVPGLASFLERHPIEKKGLATNAEPANVDFILDTAGIRKYFEAVVDGHQGFRPKPFPDVYLRVAELLGVEPGRCIVFEDSPGGVAAARAAGMRVAGVATTLDTIPGAHIMIRDFDDPGLEPWLSASIS